VIIGLAPAALTLFFGHGLPLRNIAISALIAALFALFAWLLRGVSLSGALAGFGIAFTLFAADGWPTFALLVFVFLVTLAATRAGHARKAERRLAEPHGGRTAAQVVANVGLAAYLVALLSRADWVAAFVLYACAVAVLAEAAADTCASEIGKAYAEKTFLITTRRPVPPGTDGGVSRWGVGAAAGAAGATAAVAYALDTLALRPALAVALAATLATFIDSVLGATLERRGWLNNDAVNFLSTTAAVVLTAVTLLVLYLLV